MSLKKPLSENDLSRLFNLLRHPLRREILRQLSVSPQTYSQLLRKLDVKESSFLNYHLRKMDGLLVEKNSDGKYKLNAIGKICSELVLRVDEGKNIYNLSKLQQLIENLKSTALGSQITFFLLTIILLLELIKLHVIDIGLTIGSLIGGTAFSSVLIFFIYRKQGNEIDWYERKEKISAFLLFLTIYIIVHIIVHIAFKLL